MVALAGGDLGGGAVRLSVLLAPATGGFNWVADNIAASGTLATTLDLHSMVLYPGDVALVAQQNAVGTCDCVLTYVDVDYTGP